MSLNYQSYVAPEIEWDVGGLIQLTLLAKYGLRRYHKLLDIGCGPLRAGRYFMVYLNPGNYFGIEPNVEMFRAGVEEEVGWEFIAKRRSAFQHSDQWPCQEFGVRDFDYILLQSVWTHATLNQIELCMHNSREVVADTGMLFASVEESLEDSTVTEWQYPDVVSYTLDTFSRLAERTGWDFTRLPDRHNSGILQWVMLRPIIY